MGREREEEEAGSRLKNGEERFCHLNAGTGTGQRGSRERREGQGKRCRIQCGDGEDDDRPTRGKG